MYRLSISLSEHYNKHFAYSGIFCFFKQSYSSALMHSIYTMYILHYIFTHAQARALRVIGQWIVYERSRKIPYSFLWFTKCNVLPIFVEQNDCHSCWFLPRQVATSHSLLKFRCKCIYFYFVVNSKMSEPKKRKSIVDFFGKCKCTCV